MTSPPQAMAILLCLLTIVSDVIEHRVRNTWLLAALIIGAGWMIWSWLNENGAPPWTAGVGLLIGLLALLPFYVMRWMGAGDVKFFATLGFLLGGKALLPIWIIASVLGGIHAVAILLSRLVMRHAGPGLTAVQAQVGQSHLWQRVLAARAGRKGLPYAAYMAVGALLTMKFTDLTHW
ncbi:prepilin peptidase CpaA [Rhodanobacter sp. K2T2]|uniref:A24 family peptidase n=1 Tax=Rhodanobacter sp. K2T2 TaxID=2723085 RepID=UPI001809B242|nr:prepilin peptidase [Rhodanobacter sp. K2T2]NYE28286.1 prepilin peptidase CpaA [Rhodanobacter sp. K2T2]